MATIPAEKIDEIRLVSDIVEVVSGYLTLRLKGRNYFGLCPFHKEKTPSFSVNPDLQIFHCFGCGAGGNVFTFLMRMEGVSFPEAVKLLAQRAGIVLPEEDEDVEAYREKEALYYVNNLAAQFYGQTLKSPQGESARLYLSKRGISESEYEVFGLGVAPNSWDALLSHATSKKVKPKLLVDAGLVIRKENDKVYDRFRGRIIFSIKNLTGQVVAFGARRMVNDNSPKYINSPETAVYQKRMILYGLYLARDLIRKQDEVVIVEGYTDVISLYRYNVRNVVATSGTALTEDHARLLRRYTSNAVLLYDSDSAGAAAALRGADILLENGMEVKLALLPAGTDPDEFARDNGESELRRLITGAQSLLEFKLERLEKDRYTTSSTQQSKEMRDILASVARVGDPIRRSFLVRDLADRMKLREEELWEEIAKLERRQRFRGGQKVSEQTQDDTYFATSKGGAELGLLQISMSHPDLVENIIKNMNIDLIGHDQIRSLFRDFQDKKLDPLTFKPQAYLTSIHDETVAATLSKMMISKHPHPDPWQFARDCIIKFNLSLVDLRIKEIKEKLKSPGLQSDSTELLEELKYALEERETISRGEMIVGDEPDKANS